MPSIHFLRIAMFMGLVSYGWAGPANRLTYLHEDDPFYVGVNFPKLTTPQWIGEPGVEAVVTLGVDDMRNNPQKYEAFLRPILDRLKKIDGRAPVSIFCNTISAEDPMVQGWLGEGLSIEVHTLSHPCPILAKGDFQAGFDTFHGCVEMINRIKGNAPVAFRTPCCDSINSPSPRLYSEIFNRTTAAGQFLQADSSVMNLLTPNDPALPRELVTDPNGKEKFRKYVPFPSFVTTIENYPYPYVIGKLCWEFPAIVPSDWEAQHVHGTNNPVTVADWKSGLDATVLKQGVFNFIFHPHGWIASTQMVEFIDYAVTKYGSRVKFLNYHEAVDRLNKHLLAGEPLRGGRGRDNGVRLIDVNNDGYLDVVIANERARKTRIWQPGQFRWRETDFPASLVADRSGGNPEAGPASDGGVRFGVVQTNGFATALIHTEKLSGAWNFDGEKWVENKSWLSGLDANGKPVFTSRNGRDRGVRFRDLDNDGRCELLVGNETQRSVFIWSEEDRSWMKAAYELPPGTSIVDAEGRDNGLRFVDLNGDGSDDLVFSNPQEWSIHIFISTAKKWLGWDRGWSFKVNGGKRGDPGEIPMIVRRGTNRNNGVWFHSQHLWVQNEDTAQLPDLVDRRSFASLLTGAESPAKSPQEELLTFQARPGFKVELVAAEPLVIDPVAFDWGEDGRLWVAEMRDYPLGMDGHGQSGGVIKFLQDTDGDGRYDKATVFMEGVHFPNGVMPWRKGVLVSAAPEIFYAEDTDGDGKADLKQTLLVGFREGNQQHRINGFDYGLDGWVYAANGDSAGIITNVEAVVTKSASAQNRAAAKSGRHLLPSVKDLRGYDLRFDPDTANFELVAGQTQFGRHRDDWGDWFGNNNPNWLWHYFVPIEFLSANPPPEWKNTRHNLANYPERNRVFAISNPQRRFNWPEAIREVTSANSATPYRDDLFGSDFATSVFVSEPANNVVHREVLEREGVTFRSHRADDEPDREFLASTDNWFRPTLLKTGPDGALYVADMYRLVIEHPEYFPEELKNRPDLRAGDDKGRIWRVYPEDKVLRKVPRMDGLAARELVAHLESASGWERDTAQRLLSHAVSAHGGSASANRALSTAGLRELRGLVTRSVHAKTRLQALSTLATIGELHAADLVVALKDKEPMVRAAAVRLAAVGPEAVSSASNGRNTTELAAALLQCVSDADARVRYEIALSFHSPVRSALSDGRILARMALRDDEDNQVQAAILNATEKHAAAMLEPILNSNKRTPQIGRLLEHLAQLAVTQNLAPAIDRVVSTLAHPAAEIRPKGANGIVDRSFATWQLQMLKGFADGCDASKVTSRRDPAWQHRLGQLAPAFAYARQVSADPAATEEDRVLAAHLLGRGGSDPDPDQDQDLPLLGRLLKPTQPATLQKAALDTLKRSDRLGVANELITAWNEFSPSIRTEVLNTLLSRDQWANQLLAAIEKGIISPGEISPTHQQILVKQRGRAVRERALSLFGARHTDRQQLVRNYETVKDLTADSGHGALLFRQNCATCHRLKGEGNEVGPDLGTVADKPIGTFLVAILDPNQACETKYVAYTATTRTGREITGVIVSETPGSLTVRSPGGAEEVITRSDIESLVSSRLSLMPEGLETVLTPQNMADLIAFIRSR